MTGKYVSEKEQASSECTQEKQTLIIKNRNKNRRTCKTETIKSSIVLDFDQRGKRLGAAYMHADMWEGYWC